MRAMTTVTDTASGLNSGRRPDRGGPALPAFFVMTDETRLPDPCPVIEVLPPGGAVIFRHYGAPDREDLAARVVAGARRRGVPVLIAADPWLAERVGADGLHLPAALAAREPRPGWTRRRPGWLVTAAAHSPAGLRRAWRAGADAALLAPVFATASHPEAAPIGALRFAAWCRASPLPVYALGGVTAATWRRLAGSGAAGFAGIGEFLSP